MIDAELRTLTRSAAQPSVSLLLTTANLTETEVHGHLRNQARIAIERILTESGPDIALALADLLDTTIATTTLRPGQRGIAVFVNQDVQRVVPIMTEVHDRVVVDTTFATRDLVRATQRSPQYRVVTMSDRATRLFDGNGFTLTEVRGLGFPFAVSSDEPVRPGSARRKQLQHAYVSSLDAALRPHQSQEPLPLIVVGIEPRVSTVTNRSAFRHDIIGTVRARCEYPDTERLAELVAPITDAIVDANIARATRELDSTPGQRIAFGMSDVWNLAEQGRGELLIVEEGFAYPARLDPTTNQPIPAPDPTAPGVVDDLVDDVIEGVLTRRGRCVVVPDGTLGTGTGIAMKLRY